MLKVRSFLQFSRMLSNKPAKYVKKQFDDIAKYGTTGKYPNVSDDILEKYTPFRRLSKKKCTLSEPEYFINKFEKESTNELPPLWSKMSEAEKVDFIVKNRYERLVSNKIMDDIKNSRVENSFILSTDGKIKYAGTLNSSTHCCMPPKLAKNSITIHNHPKQFVANRVWNYSELDQVNKNSRPFSMSDLAHAIGRNTKKAYVVDSHGTKFSFIPKYDYQKHGDLDFYAYSLYEDLADIQKNAFNGTRSIEDAFKMNYLKGIKRVRSDVHEFKILNFFDNFDSF